MGKIAVNELLNWPLPDQRSPEQIAEILKEIQVETGVAFSKDNFKEDFHLVWKEAMAGNYSKRICDLIFSVDDWIHNPPLVGRVALRKIKND
jgi:hypothetical protein